MYPEDLGGGGGVLMNARGYKAPGPIGNQLDRKIIKQTRYQISLPTGGYIPPVFRLLPQYQI
jgi:hypothetical protein